MTDKFRHYGHAGGRALCMAILTALTVAATLPSFPRRADAQTSPSAPGLSQPAPPAHAEAKLNRGRSEKVRASRAGFRGEIRRQ